MIIFIYDIDKKQLFCYDPGYADVLLDEEFIKRKAVYASYIKLYLNNCSFIVDSIIIETNKPNQFASSDYFDNCVVWCIAYNILSIISTSIIKHSTLDIQNNS